jgi:hypothetical protein
MISTDAEFEVVSQQLARAESALGAIRRDVLPLSRERYLLMAEAYVDQILALRAEIDEYLGMDLLRARAAEPYPAEPDAGRA